MSLHPGSPVSQSYSETYNRAKNYPSDDFLMARSSKAALMDRGSTKAILTDRGQYMNYLEAQLDRVNAALLAQNTLSERISGVDNTNAKLNERIDSIAKVARLSQTFSEKWGEDTTVTLSRLSERVATIEGTIGGNQTSNAETKSLISNVTDQMSSFERLRLESNKNIDSRLQEMEAKIVRLATDNAESSAKFSLINRRFEDVEAAFEGKLREVEVRAEDKLQEAKSAMDAKILEVQRACDAKIANHSAELARLRHEASLMENRMLVALAKQVSREMFHRRCVKRTGRKTSSSYPKPCPPPI